MSKDETSLSNTAGRRIGQIGSPALAADLVSRSVSAIVAAGINATLSAQAATRTIPVVFAIGADAVSAGLVASLRQSRSSIKSRKG